MGRTDNIEKPIYAYGSLHINVDFVSPTTITIGSANVWRAIVPMTNQSVYKNVIPDAINGKITVYQTGIYKLNFSCCARAVGAIARRYGFGFGINNNVPVEPLIGAGQDLDAALYSQIASFGLARLNVGDYVKAYVINYQSGDNIVIAEASVVLQLLEAL